ncbi:PqqD family protein [Sphingomonas psychrolutea]|uniref:PqqD family protein n=1 Tax=Sphingomonas psychrolutea TaxID=1259676 RepID=A0ABQ1H342_9SPHN|nr:PqqD family protein [Sphingomonas psychrolutea]GGA55902.1 hypothetical protein GCM10011395_27910 [Sphingomonas psychrolutea]
MSISKQGDWISAKVGDEIVMMSAEEGKYIGLNDVGARIWELLDESKTRDALEARLLEEFDVTPDACRAELDSFLTKLAEFRAITLN